MIKPYYQDKLVTLYHGDAMAIAPQIGKVDFIFTDPPYGHRNNDGDLIQNIEKALGKKGAKGKARPIRNDGGKEAHAIATWLFAWASTSLRHGGCCCCCGGGGGPDPQFARWSLLADGPLEFIQLVPWDKGPMGLGWHYRRSYETVIVAKRPGKTRWFDTSHRVENIIRPGNGIRKIIPSKDDHPTPKPPELAAHFIRLHSRPGDLVVDPFCGAGSTILAARRLKRRAIGIELEERWLKKAVAKLKAEEAPE